MAASILSAILTIVALWFAWLVFDTVTYFQKLRRASDAAARPDHDSVPQVPPVAGQAALWVEFDEPVSDPSQDC